MTNSLRKTFLDNLTCKQIIDFLPKLIKASSEYRLFTKRFYKNVSLLATMFFNKSLSRYVNNNIQNKGSQ